MHMGMIEEMLAKKDARIAQLESALHEIIKCDEDFYRSLDYIYDNEDQDIADIKSVVYAICREIAKKGLKQVE